MDLVGIKSQEQVLDVFENLFTKYSTLTKLPKFKKRRLVQASNSKICHDSSKLLEHLSLPSQNSIQSSEQIEEGIMYHHAKEQGSFSSGVFSIDSDVDIVSIDDDSQFGAHVDGLESSEKNSLLYVDLELDEDRVPASATGTGEDEPRETENLVPSDNSFAAADDTCTSDQDPDVKPTGKGGDKGKQTSKRKVKKTAKSQLVTALHTTHKEMKADMEAMEKRQRLADEKATEEEKLERDTERQRRLEVEERWRREDREYAQRAQREEREFRLAMMAMMQQQTTLLGRLLNEDQPRAQRPHSSHMYMHHPPPHDQMPHQPRAFTPRPTQTNPMSQPHSSHVPLPTLCDQPRQPPPHAFMHQPAQSDHTPQQTVNSIDSQYSVRDQGRHQEEHKEYTDL